MFKHLFDREERHEAARIETLRGLLDQVKKPDFWHGLSQGPDACTAEPDSFQQAVAHRAEALSVSPERLLTNYAQQLRESTYPTPDCLEADDVQSIVAASGEPTAAQAAHIEGCVACQQLLVACEQNAAEMEKLIAKVRESAAEADPQLWLELGTSDKFPAVYGNDPLMR
jgi:hypothetical protein